MFRGEQECQKARNKSAGVDSFSTESVAQEIIDHKLAQEKLREVSVMIDMRGLAQADVGRSWLSVRDASKKQKKQQRKLQ